MTEKRVRYGEEDLAYFKKLILEERERAFRDQEHLSAENLRQTIEASSGEGSHFSNHLSDTAAVSYEREFSLTLSERQSKYLDQIEDALQRIIDGTYGVCMVTNELIPKERLEAVLVAKYSIEGKKLLTKGQRVR